MGPFLVATSVLRSLCYYRYFFFVLEKKATHFLKKKPLMLSPVIAAKGHILRSQRQIPFIISPLNMATHANASVHSSCAHLPPRQLQYGGREWPLKVRTQIQKSISKSNNSKLKVDC